MGKAMILEQFDDAAETGNVSPSSDIDRPHPEFEAGFTAGYARALAEIDVEQGRLSGDLVQAIGDMEFGFAEAQRLILDRLTPFLHSLAERLLPELSDISLGTHLVSALQTAAETDMDRRPELCIAPQNAKAVSAILVAQADRLPAVTLHTDPSLSDGQAILRAASSETAFDSSRVISELQDVLLAICHQTSRSRDHG